MADIGYIPTTFSDSLELYIGSCATGRATASSTDLNTVVFAQLAGQPAATTFTPADVGCPILIVGGGAVSPYMPEVWEVQGAPFWTTIAAYVSPSRVTLANAPITSFFNTGFFNIVVFRRCLMQLDNYTVQKSIAPGTRDTFDFTVLTTANPYFDRFSVLGMGQPVLLLSSDPAATPRIFGGLIDTITRSNMVGTRGTFAWTCHCAAYDGIAGRRVVNPAFPNIFTGDCAVVFAQIGLTYLSDEGIGIIATSGPTITVACPVGAYVNTLLDQCVQQLAAAGEEWYWYADPLRNYILAPRTATAAAWDIDDGSDLLAGQQPIQLELTETHDQLSTFTFGIGQNILLNAINGEIVGDGVQRTWNMPQKFATEPVVTLNGNPQTVGILGVETGKDWYWNQGSTTLTQDAGGAVLTDADTLIVAYQFTYAGVASSPNYTGAVERQRSEAGSGSYDHVIQVSKVVTSDELLDMVVSYSQQYGIPAKTAKISTLRPGLAPGQLQHITLPDIGTDGDFLIATMRISSHQKVIQYDYTAFSGANVGNGITGLVQFINRGDGSLQLLQPLVPITAAQPADAVSGQNTIHAGNGASVTFPNPVGAGNLLVIAVNRNSVLGNPPAVSDSQANVWTQAQYGQTGGGFPNQVSILYAHAKASGVCTVTCVSAEWQAVMEFSGVAANAPIATAGAAVGTTPPTLVLADATDIVVTALCNVGGAITVSGSEVLLGSRANTGQPGIAYSYDKPGAGSFTSSLRDSGGSSSSVFVSVAFARQGQTGPPPQTIDVRVNPQGPSVTTKGDLQGFGTVPARIPVGTDGYVLTADSGAALGVSYQPGGGGGSSAVLGTAKFDLITGAIANSRYTGAVSGVTRTAAGVYVVALTGSPTNYLPMVMVRNQSAANFWLVQTTTSAGFNIVVLNASATALVDPDSVYLTVVYQ